MEKVSDIYDELRKSDKNMRHLAIAGIIGDSVATEFMMCAEEIKNMKSVDKPLEINCRNPERLDEHLLTTLNRLYALAFAITTRAAGESAVELLKLVNRLNEQSNAQFAALPMRDLRTMAGSLLLDKIWKEGWKVEYSKAF